MALSLQRYARDSPNSGFHKLLKERIDKNRQQSMLIATDQVDHLPESLIIEILLRLPVRDLLRFKCVCKSWYSIISSPGFITEHLKKYCHNDDSWRSCLLVSYEVNDIYELLLDETLRLLKWVPLFRRPMKHSFFCGPCDGIYFLSPFGVYEQRALWNPATNELKILPEMNPTPCLPSNITYSEFEDFGFGVDPVTGDYKVVVIKGHGNINLDENIVKPPSSVLVYSLWTNSWRYCGDLTRAYYLEINKCYTYVDGFFFWLGSCNHFTYEVIVSFDMATDSYKELGVPDYVKPSCKCLAIYNSSPALLSLHETQKILDIWTYKQGSWTKTLTMGPLPHIWNPVGHWKDSFILLETKDRKLVLIDPDSKELKYVGYQYCFKCCGVFAYMESLVSFKAMLDDSKLQLHLEEVGADSNQA